MITIYTDGSCRNNPGIGGYGIILKYRNYRKEISNGFKKTTNNRMELLAVIISLESLKSFNRKIILYSDSKYVVDTIKNWLKIWIKSNFINKKNMDLWKRFLKIYKKCNIKVFWIKGHLKNIENIFCDKLAFNSSKSFFLFDDYGYENFT